jgi:hypothetical protein
MELREPSDTVLDKFLEHPRAKHIHIIMQDLPAEGELVACYVDRSSLIIAFC